MNLAAEDNQGKGQPSRDGKGLYPAVRDFLFRGQPVMEGKMQKKSLVIIIAAGVIGLIGFWRLERGGCVEPVVISSPTIVGDSQPVTVAVQAGSDSTQQLPLIRPEYKDNEWQVTAVSENGKYRAILRQTQCNDPNWISNADSADYGGFIGRWGYLASYSEAGDTLFERNVDMRDGLIITNTGSVIVHGSSVFMDSLFPGPIRISCCDREGNNYQTVHETFGITHSMYYSNDSERLYALVRDKDKTEQVHLVCYDDRLSELWRRTITPIEYKGDVDQALENALHYDNNMRRITIKLVQGERRALIVHEVIFDAEGGLISDSTFPLLFGGI